MLGHLRLTQVIATGAACTALAVAHAGTGCAAASAEDLLAAAPEPGTSGFVLAERLCATTLVRSPARPDTLPVGEPEAGGADAARPAPALPARPVMAAPEPAAWPLVPARPVGVRRDPAGRARIRAVAPLVASVAQRHDIDPLLLHALAHVESRHQAGAISPAGARGLMQVMPATGRSMGVAAPDSALLAPEANLEASARYLKRLQARFGNDLRLVLAAYNAGEGAVERHGRRVPPYAETQAYVRNVMAVYGELRRRFAGHA